MKKLLLFLIAVIIITAASGRELSAYADKFGADSCISYQTEGGESIGETIILKNSELSEKDILYKLGAIYHFSSQTAGIKIVYGYTPKLRNLTFVESKPVNFQLTFTEGAVTISNPVNMGSF